MTVVYNAVLIRFEGGHTYVDRSNGAGRRELYLEMGGIVDEDLARRYGAQFLALSRDEISTLVEQGQVRAVDQVPGLGFSLGDAIDGDLIRSLGAQLTGDGDAQVTIEVADQRQLRLEALARQMARAGSGARSEFSAPAVDQQEQGSGSDTTPPAWSNDGQVELAIGAPWIAPRPFHLSWLELSAAIAGSGPTKVLVARNGSKVGEAVLPTSDKRAVRIIDRGFATGDEMVLAISVAGPGCSDLSITPRGAMI